MSQPEVVAAVTGGGLLALDPVGAVLALTAVSLGVTRRGLTAMVVSFGVTAVAMGSGATWLVRAGLARWDLARYLPSAQVLTWLELALGLGLLVLAVVLASRARRPATERARRIRITTAGLVGTGVVLASSLVVDPGFVVTVGVAVSLPAASWPLVFAWWGLLSQVAMVLVWLGHLTGRAVPVTDLVRRALGSVRGLLRRYGGWAVALAGVLVVLDAGHRLLALTVIG